MKRLWLVAIAVAGLLVNVIPAQESPEDANEDGSRPVAGPLADAARKVASSRRGLGGKGLRVVNGSPLHFPLTDRRAHAVKVMDPRTGVVTTVALDDEGREVDPARFAAEERSTLQGLYGAMDPRLADMVATGPQDEPIPVIVWLREARLVRPRTMTRQEARRVLASREGRKRFFDDDRRARKGVVLRLTRPMRDELAALGLSVRANEHSPALYGELLPDTIRGLAEWPQVERIYHDAINYTEMNKARFTLRAAAVNNRTLAGTTTKVDGAGVKVGQVEVGGIIASDNPYLQGVTADQTNACFSTHSTAVAGMLRSTHDTVRGIAPGMSLWIGGSCTGSTSQLQGRASAAMSWGARVLNLSWGSYLGRKPGSVDRFYDDLVFNYELTVVKSAGNRACNAGSGNTCTQPGDGYITSPGLGYNVITVGGIDDHHTNTWPGDEMDQWSSYVNPLTAHNDREKPELVAPDIDINSTTTSDPWTGLIGSGTSYAAPMVSGIAALMLQRDPALELYPEGVKAVLMVTARNVEGARRLSDKDGAGAPAALRADDVLRGVTGDWNGVPFTCADHPAGTTFDLATMTLRVSARTRAAIVWAVDPGSSNTTYTDQPSADLDLVVLGPDGTVVRSSTSFDNNFEIVDFVARAPGVYTIRAAVNRCDVDPQRLAFAWWQPTAPAQ